MKRNGPGRSAARGICLAAAIAALGCGDQNKTEPPSVDLTGSWSMESTLSSATCPNAFVALLAVAFPTLSGTVDLTMIQQEANLTVSAPRAILNGTVSAENFAVSGQVPLMAGGCSIGLMASISAAASLDAKSFVGASRYTVQTNAAQDCLGVASCTIDWSSVGSKKAS